MPPDAEDASPSPEYQGDLDDEHDFDDMTELKYEGEAKSSSEPSPTAQNDGSAPKKNSKDPQRPRRKKARRACFACQRAHLTCGMFIYPSFCLILLLLFCVVSILIHRR